MSGGGREGEVGRVDVAADGSALGLPSDGPAAASDSDTIDDDEVIEAELLD